MRDGGAGPRYAVDPRGGRRVLREVLQRAEPDARGRADEERDESRWEARDALVGLLDCLEGDHFFFVKGVGS